MSNLNITGQNRLLEMAKEGRMDSDLQKSERFKKPTEKELIEIAILFNDGKLDHEALSQLLAYGQFIVDRLYENGNINQPTEKEMQDGWQEIINQTPLTDGKD